MASVPKTLKNLCILNDSTMGLRPRQAKSLKIHRFFKGGEPSKNLQKPKDFECFSYGPPEIVQNGRLTLEWHQKCDFGYVFGAESLQEL